MSFELILPFFSPELQELILDPTISDLMITGGKVFVDRDGVMARVPGLLVPHESLDVAVQNIARCLGGDIGRHAPILDTRLPDGSRVAAVYSPCSMDGITLTIRKFARFFTPYELLEAGCVTGDVLGEISNAIENRKNVLVSGGTGAGKTTFLNAFIQLIPENERLIVIEKPAELKIEHENAVRWESVDELPGRKAVTVAHLLRAALRHRPDRIIVGEVRDESAYDMLQAMNTGHSGTFSTIHSDNALLALYRVASLALSAHTNLDHQFVRGDVASAIHFVLHVERSSTGRRYVSELIQVHGYDESTNRFETAVIYTAKEKKQYDRQDSSAGPNPPTEEGGLLASGTDRAAGIVRNFVRRQ